VPNPVVFDNLFKKGGALMSKFLKWDPVVGERVTIVDVSDFEYYRTVSEFVSLGQTLRVKFLEGGAINISRKSCNFISNFNVSWDIVNGDRDMMLKSISVKKMLVSLPTIIWQK